MSGDSISSSSATLPPTVVSVTPPPDDNMPPNTNINDENSPSGSGSIPSQSQSRRDTSSYDGRPPGGTARSGTKTPRKVQWANTKSIMEEGVMPQEEAVVSTHELDEQGLDPDAFKTLTHALERHRSTSQQDTLQPSLSYATPSSPDVGLDSSEAPSRVVSGTSTPTLVPSVQGEQFIFPDERAGVPRSTGVDALAESHARNVVRAHTTRRRGFWGLARHGKHHPRRSTATASESEGEDEKHKRAHTRRRRHSLRPHHGGDIEADGADSDIGEFGSMSRSLGGGILSTLLTLYDHQQHAMSEASIATTPTVTSSNADYQARDYAGPPRETPNPRRMKPRMGMPYLHLPLPARGWTHAGAQSAPTSPALPVSASIPPVSPTTPPLANAGEGGAADDRLPPPPSGRFTRHIGASTSSLSGFFDRSTPAPIRAGAGQGGGALSALIASTGNISGAAAPTASKVAPNIKRPGYHLSRYSLDSAPQMQKQTSTGGVSDNLNEDDENDENGTGTGTGTGSSNSNNNKDFVERVKKMKRTSWDWTATMTGTQSGYSSGAATPVITPGGTMGKKGYGSKFSHMFGARAISPQPSSIGDESMDEKKTLREKERKKKRKKAEIYITRHVAQILQRQEFILKLARAMMMFGGPSHRLPAQIQSTAKVLEIDLSCMYLPDTMIISFDDSATGTSNIKFIRQGSALDLGKLQDAYQLYWRVIHDECSVSEASAELNKLMLKKPLYNWWQLILIGGFCSMSICSVSFAGSFIDSLVVFPLGALLVAIQLLSVRNELYSNVFEITVATLLSFISAALAATHKFCYPAVASSAVVLILPGFIVLCGSLEIASRNIVSGAVRLCFALMYSLFLGFGLAIGAQIYQEATKKSIYGATDYTCSQSHDPNGPWYQRTPSEYWAFLTVPAYSLFLSMRQQAPYNRRELLMLVLVSCAGWVTNHFTSKRFPTQNDISSACGAFAVGIISNVYGKFFNGNAFVVMITGILFQLPSGLGNGGLLTFAQDKNSGDSSATSYLSGFETALQLISVSLGLTVGLGISLVCVHPIQSRRRAGGVFSL